MGNMGKASREKWLRRVEIARLAAQPKSSSRLDVHVPWLAPTAFTVVLAIAGGWGLGMTPFFLLIAVLLVVCLLVLWLLSDERKHRQIRRFGTVLLVALSLIAGIWNYRYNRPKFDLTLDQAYTPHAPNPLNLLGLRVFVGNYGRQAAYAGKWQMFLRSKGKLFKGDQDYDLTLPMNIPSRNEGSIADEKFEAGSTTRGWLFFYFSQMSQSDFSAIFNCRTQQDAEMTVQVSDGKTGREWIVRRSTLEMVRAGCVGPATPQ